MAEIFISYKSQRRLAAQYLHRILTANGFEAWYDVAGLRGGPDFGPQIESQLRVAKVVLVLWCARSRESQWVREEADLAKSLGSYVPVLIEPGIEAPLGFRLNQGFDLRDWSGSPRDAILDPLFAEIERRVGRTSTITRPELAKLDDEWRGYGSPNLLRFHADDRDIEKELALEREQPIPQSVAMLAEHSDGLRGVIETTPEEEGSAEDEDVTNGEAADSSVRGWRERRFVEILDVLHIDMLRHLTLACDLYPDMRSRRAMVSALVLSRISKKTVLMQLSRDILVRLMRHFDLPLGYGPSKSFMAGELMRVRRE